jgi:predicted cupin superfamily sugar epimerase
MTASELIKHFQLEKHPEGGYFKEVYRSSESIAKSTLPSRFSGDRSFSTAIYFLLETTDFSAFHRIKSDEIWHFYSGSALTIFELTENGKLLKHFLGSDLSNHENFQIIIKAGSWFGARLNFPGSFAFVGCTVAPGFDFYDFELADRNSLIKNYPEHKELIISLTKI